jgi:hypothetical protein
VTKHDGVQVDSILIDQTKFGEDVRQVRTGNFDLPVALGLQLADRGLKIILNKPGVGADGLQRARDDSFRPSLLDEVAEDPGLGANAIWST